MNFVFRKHYMHNFGKKKNLQISFLNYFDTRTVKKQNKKTFFFVNCSTSDFSPSYWDIRINGLVTEKCSLCCRVKFEVPLRMHHTSMQLYGTYNHIFHYIKVELFQYLLQQTHFVCFEYTGKMEIMQFFFNASDF